MLHTNMTKADAVELVAALMLAPDHVCPEGCLCAELRNLPDVQKALERIRQQVARA